MASSLQLLNLVSVEAFVIQNLPLLGGSLVHSLLLSGDLRESNFLFDDSLQFDKNFLHLSVVGKSVEASLLVIEVRSVVGISDLMNVGAIVFVEETHLLGLFFKLLPQLLSSLFRGMVIVSFVDLLPMGTIWERLVKDELFKVISYLIAIGFKLGDVTDVVFICGVIVVVVFKLNLRGVVSTVSEGQLPITLVHVLVIILIQRTGSWSWVSVHDLRWWLVVCITGQANASLE